MIKTVADLLNSLLEKERQVLAEFSFIKHGPMIGSMYEGLTKKFLEMSIFDDLKLKIVSGKIIDKSGNLSDQVDCMLVQGEGRQIPYTDMYIYDLDKVIAIIEVKKNLYSSDLASAYSNLLSPYKDLQAKKEYWGDYLRDSFKLVTHKDIHSVFTSEIEHLTTSEKFMAVNLEHDEQLPVRIIFGYDGFASENSLRESFITYLETALKNFDGSVNSGYSPYNFPSLIICGSNCLLKLNGMPYAMKMTGDLPHEVPGTNKKDWFPIYGSANRNSTIIFLEILWSKLRSKFYISTDIFGDDLDIEHISPLLFCKGVESEEKSGWLYCLHPMNDAQLLTPIHDLVWVPKEITSLQLEVFGLMAELDEISVDSKNLQALIVESGQGSEQFIESFVSSGLVYVNEENKLKYLTTKLEIVMLPDGRILAADNNDNRLTKWLNVNGYGKRLHIKGIHSDV